MTQTKMEDLSREELIAIILSQAAQIEVMRKEMEVLRLKLEKRQKPPTNSGNSSQPPSQDQKSEKLVNRPKRKHGRAKGHTCTHRRCGVKSKSVNL